MTVFTQKYRLIDFSENFLRMVFPCPPGRWAAIERVTPQVELVKGLVKRLAKELSESQIKILNLIESNSHITKREMAEQIEMIKDALSSDGVEEIFKLNDDKNAETDILDDDYLAKIEKIKLPNTKIKLLQQLLAKAIEEFKKVNRVQGIDFSKKMQSLVEKYNERKESDVLRSEVLDDFTDEIIDLYHALKKESFNELGIDFEEKAFYDILKALTVKYDFEYPHDKLLVLAKEVKQVVDDKAKYTDWSKRSDIKAELKADLIILLAENDYPPVDRDEVYKEIFEQAENFKKYQH